uniref:RING-type domain-containing protein n=1 Tax=Lotharella globosa TaxID=91324 RepID=A0A7S4DWY9_9EUKA|mmetsp:Transcript_21796/g.43784  ORF Transcript_21796/g.43784 Transcript_21796/m.43784 type:complete len:591 (+) Transcript_21796:43-1815(+)
MEGGKQPPEFGRRASRRNVREKRVGSFSGTQPTHKDNILEMTQKLEALQMETTEKSETIRALYRNYHALSNLCASQSAKIRTMSSEMASLRKEATKSRYEDDEMQTMRTHTNQYKRELDQTNTRYSEAKARIRELECSLSEKETQIDDMDKAEDELMEKLRVASEARQHTERQLTQRIRMMDEWKREQAERNQENRDRIESMEQEADRLETKLSEFREKNDALMREKNKGLNFQRRVELQLAAAKDELHVSRTEASGLRKKLQVALDVRQGQTDQSVELETSLKNLQMSLKNANQTILDLNRKASTEQKQWEEKLAFADKIKKSLQLQVDEALESVRKMEARLKCSNDAKDSVASLKELLEISRKEKFRMFEACNTMDANLKQAQEANQELESSRIKLREEAKRLREEKEFSEQQVGKLEEANTQLRKGLQTLRDTKSDQPVGWSDRMAQLIKDATDKGARVLELERKLFETQQELAKMQQQARTRNESKNNSNEDLKTTIDKLIVAERSMARVFTCSQCKQIFRDPVTAGCGHSFCKECSTKLEACSRCTKPSSKKFKVFPNALLSQLATKHMFRLQLMKQAQTSYQKR